MKRRYERWWAAGARRAQHYKTRLAQIVKNAGSGGDIDDAAEKRDVQVAEANALADSAAELRGGVAKIAQVRAYLEGSTGFAPEAQAILEKLWDALPAADRRPSVASCARNSATSPRPSFCTSIQSRWPPHRWARCTLDGFRMDAKWRSRCSIPASPRRCTMI